MIETRTFTVEDFQGIPILEADYDIITEVVYEEENYSDVEVSYHVYLKCNNIANKIIRYCFDQEIGVDQNITYIISSLL